MWRVGGMAGDDAVRGWRCCHRCRRIVREPGFEPDRRAADSGNRRRAQSHQTAPADPAVEPAPPLRRFVMQVFHS
jgi:hypothetical protein